VSVAADPGQDMEREARRAEMSGDPMAPVLRALAGMTTAMAQIAGQIEEARQPASPQVVRQAVAQAIRGAVPDVVRAFNWRTILAATGVVTVLTAGAFAGGYVVRGDRQMTAGLRAGDETCRPQNGGVLCYIPIWKRLPASESGK